MSSIHYRKPLINGRNSLRHLTLFICISFLANFALSSAAYFKAKRPLLVETTTSTLLNTLKTSSTRIQQCREGCLEKFSTKEPLCQQNPECLSCWEECAKPPPPKVPKTIRETWSLYTVSMLQQDSLVLVDVAWAPLGTASQCLVTWEVSGGGLMGNLLTESYNVQLSLWPDTKYRVQVTCKNKLTGAMSRSLPLSIDTSEAIVSQHIDTFNHEQQNKEKPAIPFIAKVGQNSIMNGRGAPLSLVPAAAAAVVPSVSAPGKLSPSDEIISDIANTVDEQDNDDIDTDEGVGSVEQEIAPILPYDDQSAETINQHTNFVFNWHAKQNTNDNHHNDISSIEPLHKSKLNLMTIAALSDMQKPLMFGVIAGSLLLAVILLMYVCMLRSNSLPNDKRALIAEDNDTVVVSMPPAMHTAGGKASSLASKKVATNTKSITNGGSSPFSSSSSSSATFSTEVCKNPAICSRNTIKV